MSEKKIPERIICNLTFDEIKELIDLVSQKKIGKLDIEVEDSHLIIEDEKAPVVSMPQVQQAVQVQKVLEEAGPAAEEKSEELSGNVVKAPIVGTYYAAASPDKPPFVKIGQKVKKGDVLFIVESMKLMNEIQSEYDGVVKTIFVSNATPVEYDQPIMIIE